MKSDFEHQIAEAMQKLAVAAITEVALGDSHKSAFLKGKYAMAQEILALHRKLDADDIDKDI